MDGFLSKPLTLPDLYVELSRWLPGAAAAPAATTADGPGEAGDAAPAAAEPAAAPTLLSDTLAHIRGLERKGRSGLLARVAQLFIEASARQVDAIDVAVAAADYVGAARQCHSLKSAAGHVGAFGVAGIANELERAAQAGDAERCREYARTLREARLEAVEALRGELTLRAAS